MSMPNDPGPIEARTIDEARMLMVHELHTAVFGTSWARPQSPDEVWMALLDLVEQQFSYRPRLRFRHDTSYRTVTDADGSSGARGIT